MDFQCASCTHRCKAPLQVPILNDTDDEGLTFVSGRTAVGEVSPHLEALRLTFIVAEERQLVPPDGCALRNAGALSYPAVWLSVVA